MTHVPPTKEELDQMYALAYGESPSAAICVLITEIRRLQSDQQRLWDLCRHQRNELHCVNLISDDEFAIFAEDEEFQSVDRLETYDAAREKIRCLQALCGRAEPFVRNQSMTRVREWLPKTKQWAKFADELRAASEGR